MVLLCTMQGLVLRALNILLQFKMYIFSKGDFVLFGRGCSHLKVFREVCLLLQQPKTFLGHFSMCPRGLGFVEYEARWF